MDMKRTHHTIQIKMEFEQEADGRWLADVVDYPGVMAYGANPNEAATNAMQVYVQTIVDRLAHGESADLALPPEVLSGLLAFLVDAIKHGKMGVEAPRAQRRRPTAVSRAPAVELAMA